MLEWVAESLGQSDLFWVYFDSNVAKQLHKWEIKKSAVKFITRNSK